jgi:hypothetical protein
MARVQPALHAARVRRDHVRGRVDEVELLEQLGCSPPPGRPAHVPQVGHEQQVLLAGQQLVDR